MEFVLGALVLGVGFCSGVFIGAAIMSMRNQKTEGD
jgi:hypothetical protein